MSILISILFFQAAAAPADASQQVAAPPDDAKIVCRTIQETGSRLGGKRVCMSKREWRRLHEESSKNAQDYQNSQSKQPGNQ